VGVNGSTGVRWFAGFGGKEVTTSGSSRVFSARSIAPTSAGGTDEIIGAEYTRLASLPHTGHVTDAGAVPIGCVASTIPSPSH